jgi:two-component system sensor histidine kinase ResE
MQDIIQKFQLPAKERQINLMMESPGPLPFVYADIYLIERVLENLISNALRHTPAKGEIMVRLKELNSGVEISVQDTGSGISEENLPHIFDRFYRGDNKERSGHHSGLGLAIAQHIIELHGSKIRVDSQYGQGSLFSFILPVQEKPA